MRAREQMDKLLCWMNMPSHYQSAFFDALRSAGVNLVVHYYGRVGDDRKAMGWESSDQLSAGEAYVPSTLEAVHMCQDWKDRVHIVPGYGTPFTRQLAAFLSSQGVRWVHWSEPSHRGIKWWLSYPLKRWYATLVNRHADGAFAIGELARRDFIRWGVREDKIRLLPYSSSRPPSGGNPNPTIDAFSRLWQPLFLYVGALCARKGIDVLLRAFAASVAQCHSGGLVLVGNDTTNGEYHRLASQLGIQKRVLFAGALASSAVYSALRSAQVFVLPSRFDGWGVVIAEAASVGRAVIASEACGAAQHLVITGETGFRVVAGDARSLADAMQQYMRDPGLARTHGERSLELWSEFSPEKNVERLLNGLHALRTRQIQRVGVKSAGLA